MTDESPAGDVFLLSWDQEGLESCINVTELDRKRMWDILADRPQQGRGHDINSIVNAITLRARYNSQRHYEVYTVLVDSTVTAQDLRDMFEQDPQGAAELIRARGNRIHSDRRNSQKVLIT